MRVKDESEWRKQCADFAVDPDPRAEPFREFVVAWAEAAEEVLDDRRGNSRNGGPAIKALDTVLRKVEASTGRWTVGYLGMALVLLGTHWAEAGDPDEFVKAMTPIEQSLYLDVLATKMAELQRSAEVAEEQEQT